MAYYAEGEILELGCFKGLSTSIMARAALDAGRGTRITTNDRKQVHTRDTMKHLAERGLDAHVTAHAIPGKVFLNQLYAKGREFSFAFIDHAHLYVPMRDACRMLKPLIVDGGFCLFHDYNDPRNQDPPGTGFGVGLAVQKYLDPAAFEFYGIYGCTGLFRRRPRALQEAMAVIEREGKRHAADQPNTTAA